jgi:hypothetical protein
MSLYDYTYSKLCSPDRLDSEIIAETQITKALDHIETASIPATTVLFFKEELPSNQKTALDAVVANHDGTPLPSHEVQPVELRDVATDNDGAFLTRPKMASIGWTFHLRCFQFETCTLNSLVNAKVDGTLWGDAVVEHYDASMNLLTTQQAIDSSCVLTSLAWEPTYDYEILGGNVRHIERPASPVYLFVTAVPDVPEVMGGTKRMVNGFDLQFLDPTDAVIADGHTPKRLNYSSTYHTNKIRLCLRHQAGFKHRIQFVIEVFKA